MDIIKILRETQAMMDNNHQALVPVEPPPQQQQQTQSQSQVMMDNHQALVPVEPQTHQHQHQHHHSPHPPQTPEPHIPPYVVKHKMEHYGHSFGGYRGMGYSDSKALPNWTEDVLLTLVTEYWKRKDILRSKPPDSFTNRQKRDCWVQITNAVNSKPNAAKKTMEQIKRKWDKTIILARKALQNLRANPNGEKNFSDLPPAYQLTLAIIGEDCPNMASNVPYEMGENNLPALEPAGSSSYVDSNDNPQTPYMDDMVITELEELPHKHSNKCPHNNDDGDVVLTKRIKTEREGDHDGIKLSCDREICDLQLEKLVKQIEYQKIQHEYQLNILKSQLEFWEMKKSKLASKIRNGLNE